MKKLMITAAAAMLGIAANASAITWNLSSALSDEAFKGGTAYLIFNGTSSTIPTFNNETYLKTHTAYAIADVLTALGGGTDTGLTATVGDDGMFASTEAWGPTTAAGSNKRFFAIVIDDEGKNMTIATATKKSNITTSETSPATLTWSGSGEFSTTYKAEAVPEPTSAMLLLLGVAGLALRRRRA